MLGMIRWVVEGTLVAMLLSAIRRETGMIFFYNQYQLGGWIHRYLSWGEMCYTRTLKMVKRSKFFRKQLNEDGFGRINDSGPKRRGRNQSQYSSRFVELD
ncbi:CGH_3_HP_G0035730.mRNA.1.CDS.1 [Saccharomyces cerevisiae]|nr:CGH_1_HP_G0019410.mRNA.1.CDS.1 [Saccharomyces cerevisiae]CAI4935059.1 CGH_3_HP_G0035730.mRNA.1.CDS.1 [Saccharomyces cerevisiae]CAI4956701.1 CGH_1_HP_G0041830.mRNA.1.CDS.1 [Saccharomyces cerevisiae]CAI5034473.1 CGH_1_HP_G0105090.mRNA.1.CDS.1 [Saccharomyces cerevisiae]CAI6449789.1 CGH_1_HP_G0019410.mRNA.1.CDS.1 [Saccharomyces cerevisiae]